MLTVVQNSMARRGVVAARVPATSRDDSQTVQIPGLGLAQALASGFRSVTPGAEIYAEGEPCDDISIVTEGWVFQHQILEDGRRQILDFALPGTLLGFQPVAGSEMAHTAEALTHAMVAVIPRERLSELFARDPRFGLRLFAAASGALDAAYEHLTDVGRRTAREAVAHLILRLFGQICAAGPRVAGTAIPFPLTQEHIGDALGLTAVHVCRTLRALRQEEVVQLANGTLKILDARKLAMIAGSREDSLDVPGPSQRAMPPRARMAG